MFWLIPSTFTSLFLGIELLASTIFISPKGPHRCPGTLSCHSDPDTGLTPLCDIQHVMFGKLKDWGGSRVYRHTRSKVATLSPCFSNSSPWQTLGRAGETAIHCFASSDLWLNVPRDSTNSRDSSQMLRC